MSFQDPPPRRDRLSGHPAFAQYDDGEPSYTDPGTGSTWYPGYPEYPDSSAFRVSPGDTFGGSPGDTFGLSELSAKETVLSWGSATRSSRHRSTIYAGDVTVEARPAPRCVSSGARPEGSACGLGVALHLSRRRQ